MFATVWLLIWYINLQSLVSMTWAINEGKRGKSKNTYTWMLAVRILATDSDHVAWRYTQGNTAKFINGLF